MSKERFSADDIPTLNGKVALVTGGNGGIGLEISRQLAYHGARVYMASRNESKAQSAIKSLQDDFQRQRSNDSTQEALDVHFVPLDLMHLSSTNKCAELFLAKEQRLDILICNAGIMAADYKLSDDGIEQQFQTNHLTHFALFQKLAPVMVQTAHQSGHPSRLVNLASIAHAFSYVNPFLRLDFTSKEMVNRQMGFEQIGKYMRYSQSKLSAMLFSREVNVRFKPNEIRAVAVHPGLVASNLWESTPFVPIGRWIFIPTSDGALSALKGATSPALEEDNSWDTYFGTYGSPHYNTPASKNAKLCQDLWNLSEQLTDTKDATSQFYV